MNPELRPAGVLINRPVRLETIDAVGFDLDHTLALYDDHAVNVLAAEEAVDRLRARGYEADLGRLSMEAIPGARALSLDLRHGNVVKVTAGGAVRLARRGPDWLDGEEMRARYAACDPSDERSIWHIHSPFDVPAIWFFQAMAPRLSGRPPDTSGRLARALHDIRSALDFSHTRGRLKARIGAELERYVRPACGCSW
jgi:hypothetical protein